MPVESILETSRAAMAYERARMEVASRNIASTNVPLAPGQVAQRWKAPLADGMHFDSVVLRQSAQSMEQVGVREIQQPGHPYADEAGQVRYPDVDMTIEMTTMISASRGYEANVRAFNLLRGMMLRGLEIGAK
ncbi:hypothetical protein EBB59_02570 [Lysobacter pythonis]|uniref:Flagellar basal-body/hook protein C-terminal domain-containing protein n=1 Tax=Solilutibacter pythonis TaxID=2483112 RepID=A0A3M2I100_9GAMM|nr:flagellar basal body rod C-terminal domain-containing protein [Lysobacter pythonis]RMH94065.1 hypothetical protein EBB59_02570 [Lysobacter pythonis]